MATQGHPSTTLRAHLRSTPAPPPHSEPRPVGRLTVTDESSPLMWIFEAPGHQVFVLPPREPGYSLNVSCEHCPSSYPVWRYALVVL